MTTDQNGPCDSSITTEEELDTALKVLLSDAHENGIDPEGSWVVQNGSAAPDWEVQVFELANRE